MYLKMSVIFFEIVYKDRNNTFSTYLCYGKFYFIYIHIMYIKNLPLLSGAADNMAILALASASCS